MDYSLKYDGAKNKHIEIFYKDKKKYEHQSELRIILPNKKLSRINNGITIHLTGLSDVILDKNIEKPINASRKDFMSYVKNLTFFADIKLKNNFKIIEIPETDNDDSNI